MSATSSRPASRSPRRFRTAASGCPGDGGRRCRGGAATRRGRPTPPPSAAWSPRRSATCRCRARRSTIGDYEFQVERVAERAVESCSPGGSRSTPTTRRRDVNDAAVPSASSSLLVARQRRSSSPRSSRSSARRGPASSIRRRRAAGWPQRVARILDDPRAAGSLHRHDADRHLGGEPGPGHVRRARARRVDRRMARAVRRHAAGSPRTRVASASRVGVLTYMHIVHRRDGAQGAGAAVRAMRRSLYVSPSSRRSSCALLPLVVALNAAGNGLLRADRHQAAGGRGRALSHAPRSCSSSSRRARKAACCAANRAASCASCSSSAT